MATQIPDALNWEQYKSREPLPTRAAGLYQRPLNDENRHLASPDANRAGPDMDDYAGNDPMPPLPEAISAVFLLSDSPLRVPGLTYNMTSDEAQKASVDYYNSVLETGGAKSLALIKAAGSEANKAILKARDLGHDNYTTVGSHVGYALAASALMASVEEIYPATRQDAQSGVSKFEPSHEESARKTLARANKENLKREGFQKLPTDISQVPIEKLKASFNSKIQVPNVDRIHPEDADKLFKGHIVKDEDQDSDKFGKVIGFSDELTSRMNPRKIKDVVNQLNSPGRFSATKMSPKDIKGGEKLRTITASRAIICDISQTPNAADSIRNAGKSEEIFICSNLKELSKVPTQARKSVANFAKASTARFEARGFPADAARYLTSASQTMDQAASVDMFLAKEPNKLNLFALGMAASKGKLGTIMQDGVPMSKTQAIALGAANYTDDVTFRRAQNSNDLDIPMTEPNAVMALSLLQNNDVGVMSSKDLIALQDQSQSGKTVLDIIEQARTPEGASDLQRETRISSNGIQLLRDDKATSQASQDFLDNQNHNARNKSFVIGYNDLPVSMQEAGIPFVIGSGDREILYDNQARLGITGEKIRDTEEQTALASKIAPHLAEIEKTEMARTWVEGQTPFHIEPKRGDIVFVNRGLHIHANEELAMRQDERDMAGALTLTTQTATTSRFVNGAGNKKGQMVEYINYGSDTKGARTAVEMVSMATRVYATNGAECKESSHVNAAVGASLEKGVKVIAVNPGSSAKESPFTSALLNSTGLKALERAGYGPKTLENPNLAKLEGGHVAISTGTSPADNAKKISALVSSGKLPEVKRERLRTKTKVTEER